MKNYKPCIITTIDREVAQQWLDRAEELIRIVESNDSQYMDVLDDMPVYTLSSSQS
jgi:hypothetical protein